MKKISFFYLILFIQLLYWGALRQISYPFLVNNNFSIVPFQHLINSLGIIFPALLLSIEIFFYVFILNLSLSLFIASYIVKNKIPNWINLFFYLPVLAPAFLPAFGLYDLFIDYGLLGTKFGVVIGQSCILFPFMIRPIELHLRHLNFKYEKIAYDLGESIFATFRKVTLPLLFPSILTGTFLTLIGSFNDYLITFLIGDSQVETLPIKLLPLLSSDNRNLITISIITYLIPIILLTLFFKEDKDYNYA